MIQVNRIYLIFNRLVTKKFLVDTSEYTYIIFDHKGKRLGKIEFGKRISVPSASEIEEAIKDGFPNGATYKLIVPINVCISQ